MRNWGGKEVLKASKVDKKLPPIPPATSGRPYPIYGSSYFEGLWKAIRRWFRGASFVTYMSSNKLFELLLNPSGWPAEILLEIKDELEHRGYSVEEELEWRKEQEKGKVRVHFDKMIDSCNDCPYLWLVVGIGVYYKCNYEGLLLCFEEEAEKRFKNEEGVIRIPIPDWCPFRSQS